MNATAVLVTASLATLLVAAVATDSQAGPLRERLRERMQQRAGDGDGMRGDGMGEFGGAMSCADWSKRADRMVERQRDRQAGPAPDRADVAYGSAPRQRLDVFLPDGARRGGAPVIVMVHGGGWCVGDKTMSGVTANKVARWVSQGFVFVSANYPMVNDGADARAQGEHIAKAAAFVQTHAAEWGGDPSKVILMGHSAGAHLVSLVNADGELRRKHGVRPLLGTVSLDAGAIDVPTQMPNVYPFLKTRYLEAFGDSEAQWVAASPYHRLDRSAGPWLGVCSTQRKDDPCSQARAYVAKSESLGVRAAALPQPMGHGALNNSLGEDNDYTRAVEAFMAGLDPAVAARLRR